MAEDLKNSEGTVLVYPERKDRTKLYPKLLAMAKAIVSNPMVRKKAQHYEKGRLQSLRRHIKNGSYNESYWINLIENNTDYRVIMVNKNDKIKINGEPLIIE